MGWVLNTSTDGTRELWWEEKQQPDYEKPIIYPLFPEHADMLVYTEKGNIHCTATEIGEQRDIVFHYRFFHRNDPLADV